MLSEKIMTPKFVEWSGYIEPTTNQAEYQAIVTSNAATFIKSLSPTVDLYKLNNKFCAIDTFKHALVYYCEFTKTTFKFKLGTDTPKEVITQVKVWRDRLCPATAGLSEQIFFDHLLPVTGLVMSDGEHTEDGKAFWELRVATAFQKGYKVGFMNLANKVPMYVDSAETFAKNLFRFYGKENHHIASRLFIELP